MRKLARAAAAAAPERFWELWIGNVLSSKSAPMTFLKSPLFNWIRSIRADEVTDLFVVGIRLEAALSDVCGS